MESTIQGLHHKICNALATCDLQYCKGPPDCVFSCCHGRMAVATRALPFYVIDWPGCTVPDVAGASVTGCTEGGTVDDGTTCTWAAEATHTCENTGAITCTDGVFSETPSCDARRRADLRSGWAHKRCAEIHTSAILQAVDPQSRNRLFESWIPRLRRTRSIRDCSSECSQQRLCIPEYKDIQSVGY